MNFTKASSSNPSKKIKLTIIPPSQLFVNISSDEDVTTTPSATTTSSSPTPLNAPSKTLSNNDTSTSHDDTPLSFQSKLQISPPFSNEPTSPQPLNPLLNNISDVPPRPSNPQPLQSHPSLDITLSLSPFENLVPPSPPSPPSHRTSPTSPITINSLASPSPPHDLTQNQIIHELYHLSNLLEINLQRAIEITNPSPPTSPHISPPTLDQVNFRSGLCHYGLQTRNLFDILRDDLNRIKSIIIGPSTIFPSSITTSYS
ncbi:hypothetical protein Tco_0393861 [Tanacetum coccineum]